MELSLTGGRWKNFCLLLRTVICIDTAINVN